VCFGSQLILPSSALGGCVCWNERGSGNPVVTLPTKKRLNTELFNDRKAALNIREPRIRSGTNQTVRQ